MIHCFCNKKFVKSHDIKLSVISSEAARILSKGVTFFKLLMTYLLHLRSTGIQNPEVSLLPEHLNCLPEIKKKKNQTSISRVFFLN